MAARVTSSGPATAPVSAASLATVVEHVSRCADVSEYTRSRLRMAATELTEAAAKLKAADEALQERDALRAEVDRLRRQGGHSSRLPATTSPST